MVFSSNIFLFFFLPIFLIAYFITPQKFRNYTLLLFSIVFYAYGAPDFVFLLVGECVINYFIVRAMGRCTDGACVSTKKKLLCGLSVVMALGLLLYFKYANFFMENLNTILGWAHHEPIGWMKVALPIGISFFTFQSITYTIDVYRGTTPPSQKLTDYVLYIMMFPQLIAGPIVNYNSVAAQLVSRTSTMEDRVVGFYRFVIGLAKKVLIANTMAAYADQVFGMAYGDLATGTAWIGILAYTFQIYFDFSGYSDMAIGLGKMMGFRFPENFNDPYTSRSVTEFWKRWHMTLGNFIMNYLYIPLGGNRKGKGRMYFNLWLCFLLSGLWHGALFPALGSVAWSLVELRPLGRFPRLVHLRRQTLPQKRIKEDRHATLRRHHLLPCSHGLGALPRRHGSRCRRVLSSAVRFQRRLDGGRRRTILVRLCPRHSVLLPHSCPIRTKTSRPHLRRQLLQTALVDHVCHHLGLVHPLSWFVVRFRFQPLHLL